MARRPHTQGAPAPSTPPQTGSGDLARLLETEARLEEVLRRARQEAATLVADARTAAVARSTALETDLTAAAGRLEGQIAAERQRREAELLDGARREAQAFARVAPDQVAALAGYVVSRAIGADL